MRPIDADKLKALIEEEINRCYALRLGNVGPLSHFIDQIDAQPTVVPFEAKSFEKRNLGIFTIYSEDVTKLCSAYEEKEHKLVQVSGCDMEKLIELFAAGYTLQPPKHDLTPLSILE